MFNLRFQAATGQLENHGRLLAVRKDIARIYTVLRERELGITVGRDTGGCGMSEQKASMSPERFRTQGP